MKGNGPPAVIDACSSVRVGESVGEKVAGKGVVLVCAAAACEWWRLVSVARFKILKHSAPGPPNSKEEKRARRSVWQAPQSPARPAALSLYGSWLLRRPGHTLVTLSETGSLESLDNGVNSFFEGH